MCCKRALHQHRNSGPNKSESSMSPREHWLGIFCWKIDFLTSFVLQSIYMTRHSSQGGGSRYQQGRVDAAGGHVRPAPRHHSYSGSGGNRSHHRGKRKPNTSSINRKDVAVSTLQLANEGESHLQPASLAEACSLAL